MTGLLVWLELGLSIPKFQTPDSTNEAHREGERPFISVPRNGGEKNYVGLSRSLPDNLTLIAKKLEYIYKSPQFRTTCMYGIIFIVLGNRVANAIAFGIYVLQAAGHHGSSGAVQAVAIAALTAACLIHWVWRKGGIILNNLLAVLKTCVLLAIIGIGLSASAGASFGHGQAHGETARPDSSELVSNFNIGTSFAIASKDVASYVNSLIFVIYSYGGFEQPFHVSNSLVVLASFLYSRTSNIPSPIRC